MRDDVTALILAGGKATRLGGVDKRALVVDGQTIFARQVEALAPCVREIIVSARADDGGRGAPSTGSAGVVDGYRTVVDGEPGLGPLAGIAAGLAAARTPWLFVIAGDMPRITRAVVELVLAHATSEADAVGIRIGGRPEPLCTALRVEAWRSRVAKRIAARHLKASSLLTEEEGRVRWIEEAAVRAVDPRLRALHNVNAPEDL